MSVRSKTATAHYDVIVVGGGLSGMCAAISAARHGAKTALIHGRHVLGGNASSETRMWVRGAAGKENRETGLMQEAEMGIKFPSPQPLATAPTKAAHQGSFVVISYSPAGFLELYKARMIECWEVPSFTPLNRSAH